MRSHRWLIAFIGLLIALPILPVSMGEDDTVLAPDPLFDPQAGPDVPVWTVGDHWNYTTDIEYDYLGLVTINLAGWLNISVVLITLDFFSDGVPVYIANITGNISAEETIPFIGDINIYIELSGYIWTKAQDLSVYRSILNASVSGNVPSINGDYPFGYEYSPPLEEYDFPLVPGDTWKVNTSARLPFGASGDLVPILQNMSCGDPRSLMVPAGSFQVLPVSANGNEVLFYNSTVGNTVFRSYSVDDIAEGMVIPFELTSYGRIAPEIDVDLTVTTEQHVDAGSSFSIHGEVSESNVAVNIFFPDGTIAKTELLILGDKDFDVDLIAPIYPDDTPTLIDYGSFGIFASVNGVKGIGVVTVTTKATDLELKEGSLVFEVTGNGTIDDMITARMEIFNPSNFRAEGAMSILDFLDAPGVEPSLIVRDNISVDARSSIVFYYNFTVDHTGTYFAQYTIPYTSGIYEYNMTNNVARANFTVLIRPAIVWELSHDEGNITVDEGEDIQFHANAERGSNDLVGQWYLDDEFVSNTNTTTFSSNFFGENSSRIEPYILRYVLSENQTYPADTRTSIQYNISVMDVNRPHVIDSYFPTGPHIEALENEAVHFQMNISEPDGDDLVYIWTIGNQTFEGFRNHTLNTRYIGNFSSNMSPVNISVVIYDGRDPELNLTMTWNFTIIDVDRPFTVTFVPEPGEIVIDHDQTLKITFNATDPDGTDVIANWTFLDRVAISGTYSGIELNGTQLGLEGGEEFNLTLLLVSGSYKMTYVWSIKVNEPPIVEPDSPVPVPPIGASIVSPYDGEEIESGTPVELRVSYTDQRNLSIIWYLDGEIYTGNGVMLSDLEVGSYNLTLNLSSIDGSAPGWVELKISFKVYEKSVEVPPEDEDDNKAPMWLVPLVIAVIILVVIIVAYMLFLRRREDTDWEE